MGHQMEEALQVGEAGRGSQAKEAAEEEEEGEPDTRLELVMEADEHVGRTESQVRLQTGQEVRHNHNVQKQMFISCSVAVEVLKMQMLGQD